jgi:hypothetical protein
VPKSESGNAPCRSNMLTLKVLSFVIESGASHQLREMQVGTCFDLEFVFPDFFWCVFPV